MEDISTEKLSQTYQELLTGRKDRSLPGKKEKTIKREPVDMSDVLTPGVLKSTKERANRLFSTSVVTYTSQLVTESIRHDDDNSRTFINVVA